MRNKFPSLKLLKQLHPELAPFYTQSWVYSGITAYYSQQNRFGELEFNDLETDLIIHDYQSNTGFRTGTDYHGLVFEGHTDSWAGDTTIPKNAVVISGHKHFLQTPTYTSLGFNYWDVFLHNEFRAAPLFYEINHSSVKDAEYDVVFPVGSLRPHRKVFLEVLKEIRQDLTIVTDDIQTILDTNLRFSNLGIEVYFNKFGLNTADPYQMVQSFYDTNSQRTLGQLPHKRMHAIAKVNGVLETSCYDTTQPFITEKTFKVLAQHRPFVIFGDTNILKTLRSQGFKTFDKYCDESYDDIAEPVAKSQRAIEAIKQLVKSCEKHPDEIDSICRHNQNLFFSNQRHADNLATFGKHFLDIIK
jgi:hypothetical protein